MNHHKKKPSSKNFSVKEPKVSTLTHINLNRDSIQKGYKEIKVISSNKKNEKHMKLNQTDNSADVSSAGQSFSQKSLISDDKNGLINSNSINQDQDRFKSESDLEGIKITMPSHKSLLNSLKKTKSHQSQDQINNFSNTLTYKTDSEIDIKTSITKPFLLAHTRKDSLLSQCFTMSGDMLGVWIFVVPIAFFYGGIYLSCIVFTIMSLMIYFSEKLMLSCVILSKKTNIIEISDLAYGKNFAFFVKILICLYTWCEITISLIFLNKFMAYFLGLMLDETSESSIWLSIEGGKVLTPCLFALVILPLTLFRNKIICIPFANKIGLIIVLYIMILVISAAFSKNLSFSEEFQFTKGFDYQGLLTMFPIACFGFSKADQVLFYSQKMSNPNMKHISNSLRLSRFINLLIVLVFGIFGYVTWAKNPFDLNKYQILLLAPYGKNLAWIVGYVCEIIAVLLVICQKIERLERSLLVKNSCFAKSLSVGLLIGGVIISMFVYEIKEMMIWCGFLICSPVFIFIF